jgi:hypothetical protein
MTGNSSSLDQNLVHTTSPEAAQRRIMGTYNHEPRHVHIHATGGWTSLYCATQSSAIAAYHVID